ncbi:hypothetical protein [Natranaerobius trueperi]|uniref:hypothetical protein n=1 Tax=Natranaerobius trueperi TaxID=759412 RepID=UPI00197B941D|nr:hypothetical protein [Natranaerobius trueperi]
MQGLSVVVLVALLIAGFLAKKNPEHYGLTPFGDTSIKNDNQSTWDMKEAFTKPAIWGVIGAFLTAMIGEFLFGHK